MTDEKDPTRHVSGEPDAVLALLVDTIEWAEHVEMSVRAKSTIHDVGVLVNKLYVLAAGLGLKVEIAERFGVSDAMFEPWGRAVTVDHDALTRAARRALGNGGLLNPRQMTQADGAVTLVERALRAWPLRDPVGWVEEMVLLDLNRANTALQRLIREHATTPTIGAFFDIYRTLDTGPPRALRSACPTCDGSGSVDCLDDRRHATWCRHRGTNPGDDGDCFCSAVLPCEVCADGDRMRAVMRRINDEREGVDRR